MRRFWKWTLIPAVVLAACFVGSETSHAADWSISVGSGYYGPGGYARIGYGPAYGPYRRYYYPSSRLRYPVYPHYGNYPVVPYANYRSYYGYLPGYTGYRVHGYYGHHGYNQHGGHHGHHGHQGHHGHH